MGKYQMYISKIVNNFSLFSPLQIILGLNTYNLWEKQSKTRIY